VTELVPDLVRDAVRHKSDYAASGSFGVVTLVLLLILLLERELLRLTAAQRARLIALSAAAVPLGLAVAFTIVVRVANLLP
jgi:hypothetical protein